MTTDPDAVFAERVRLRREAAKLSQAELAQKIADRSGIAFDGSTIYKIEKGKRKVTVAEALAIASALRCSIHELLDLGVDSAFVAKEVLLDSGMEVLLEHERITDALHRLIGRQQRIQRFIADYRDRFDEDPLWLAYTPEHQDLRAHWEPLANWSGPADYLSSWAALVQSTGKRYLDDLGWVDDRTEPPSSG